jgi:hypothetical protein
MEMEVCLDRRDGAPDDNMPDFNRSAGMNMPERLVSLAQISESGRSVYVPATYLIPNKTWDHVGTGIKE